MEAHAGWRSLFVAAFRRSDNAMLLLDSRRRVVEINGPFLRMVGHKRDAMVGRPIYEFVIGGPRASEREWTAALREQRLTGTTDLRRADGGSTRIEYAGHPAVVTGQQLVLFVALKTGRRAARVAGAAGTVQARSGALSNRELQVVRMIALGDSGTEIASELQVTHNTVRTHVRNAMAKLGARSRAQLVAISVAEGLVLSQELNLPRVEG